MGIECRDEHERIVQVVGQALAAGLDTSDAILAEAVATIGDEPSALEAIVRSALDSLVVELLAHETIDNPELARILGPSVNASP